MQGRVIKQVQQDTQSKSVLSTSNLSIASSSLASHRNRIIACFVYLLAIAAASTALGQTAKKEDPKLKPRVVQFKTRDGIELRAAYFPSDKGKEAITVMLVHEWQGQASPYLKKFVVSLRNAGCAVLVPEYRGHGGSKEYIDSRGRTQTFNMSTMNKRDVEKIIKFDLEEAKQFLKKENNAGNLNLNALIMIGVSEGAVMASHFAVTDWRWPSVGRMKQGQDVKAVILISPEKLIKGIPIDPAFADPNILRLPIMIIAGKSSPESSEAERISKRIEAVKRKMGQGTVTGFEQLLVPTSLSGPALVNEAVSVIPAVTKFITTNIKVNDESSQWVERN